jgi:hypothetical protein
VWKSLIPLVDAAGRGPKEVELDDEIELQRNALGYLLE